MRQKGEGGSWDPNLNGTLWVSNIPGWVGNAGITPRTHRSAVLSREKRQSLLVTVTRPQFAVA